MNRLWDDLPRCWFECSLYFVGYSLFLWEYVGLISHPRGTEWQQREIRCCLFGDCPHPNFITDLFESNWHACTFDAVNKKWLLFFEGECPFHNSGVFDSIWWVPPLRDGLPLDCIKFLFPIHLYCLPTGCLACLEGPGPCSSLQLQVSRSWYTESFGAALFSISALKLMLFHWPRPEPVFSLSWYFGLSFLVYMCMYLCAHAHVCACAFARL